MRLLRWPGRLSRLLAAAAAGSIVLVGTGAGTALAAPGYGPPPVPVPPGIPGGFSDVLETVTVTGGAQVLGPVQSGRLRAVLLLPPGAAPDGAAVTFTEPDLADLGFGGFSRYRAVGGLGVLIGFEGARIDHLGRPATVRLRSPAITRSSIVVGWSGTRWVRFPGAMTRRGLAALRIPRSEALLVLNPRTRHGPDAAGGPGSGRHIGFRRAGAGAAGTKDGRRARRGTGAALTSAALAADSRGTRRPFPAELAALAAALLVAGAGRFIYVRRRRSGSR